MYVITYTHYSLGCAIAQAVTSRPVTAKARVRSHVIPREILCTEVRKGKVFLRVFWFSPVRIIPSTLHALFHLHVTPTRRTNELSLGNFQKTTLFLKSRALDRGIFTFFAYQYSSSYMSADVVIKVVMNLQHA